MIPVSSAIALHASEIQERFIRSPGPGGQNVNKVASAVQLRFDVAGSSSLPDQVKHRLMRLAGRRLSQEGVLTIEAHRYRTRERNRQDALERLVDLIRTAAYRPKPRKKTKPSRASKERRLESKHQRARTKSLRQAPKCND
jgi:ribosome-associated protein